MPRLPDFERYESKENLPTNPPNVQAPNMNMGKGYDTLAKAAGQAQETTIKAINWYDTVQSTTAKANFKTGMLDIMSRAENDPDYNNSKQYVQEIQKLRKESTKGIIGGPASAETAMELDYAQRVAEIQLGGIYKKKAIDVGQASALRLIDTEINNPTEASLDNIKNMLDVQVQAKIFDHKDAYQLLQKANRDLGESRISKDLNNAQTPEAVDQIKQNITSGYYEQGGVTIDPEKKKNLLEIADRAQTNAEKKVQAQAVEAMTKNRMEMITGIASGQMRIEDLNMADIAEYDSQLSTTLTKVKDFMVNYNPKLPPNEQALSSAGLMSANQIKSMRSYARSITDVFLQNDNEKLGDFVLRELDKKGDGTTPSVKLAAFANLAALKANINNQQTPQDVNSATRFNAIKAAVSFLKSSNPYLSSASIGDFIVKNYLSGADTTEKIMEEAKSVLRDKVIERYQSVAKLPGLPNKIVDGEASVEDLQSGANELESDEAFSGSYADEGSD
jgi:hypothetical protein